MDTSFASVINTTTVYGTKSNIQKERYYTKELDWIIPMVLCIIFIILATWILLSLVHYGLKTGKWNSRHHRSSDKLNVGEIYTFVVITAFICVCFLCVNAVYINIGFNHEEDEICDTFRDVALVLYSLQLCGVSIFLWLRQRVFYKNFMLNADYNRTIRIFSSLSIIFILLFDMAALVFNVLPNDNKSGPNGCIYVPTDKYKVWYWVTIVVAVVFGQITLMALFVYGLKKTSREQWIPKQFCCYGGEKNRPPTDLSISSSVESSKSNTVGRSKDFNNVGLEPKAGTISTLSSTRHSEDQSIVVQQIIWKTLIFAILSILSDIFLQVVIHYLVSSNSHRRISTTVANLNAILNVLFLLFSFVKWKEILMTFCNK